jgi:hypothetical protein
MDYARSIAVYIMYCPSHKGREGATASISTDHPTELSGSTELQQVYLRVADLEAQLEDYKRRFATKIVTT